MLCPKCGTQVKEELQNCPNCNEPLSTPPATRRHMPLWFKIIAALAVIALIAVTAGILFTERLVDVVDNQLTALQKHEIDRAYEAYTSKDFQEVTSLEDFRHFVQAYPIFVTNQSAHFTERSVKDKIGTLKGHLTGADHMKIPVEYKVIKEDGKWKILSIRLLQPSLTRNSPKTVSAQDLIAVVKKQLQEVENGNVTKAYQDYTSSEFKAATSEQKFQDFIDRYPIFAKHTSAFFHKPTTRQGISVVPVILNSAQAAAYIKYYLVYENGSWKIWSLRILAPADESRKESEADLTPSLSNVKLGLLLDPTGLIKEPSHNFKGNTGDIYANVDVHHGQAGEQIKFNFQHLDSRSSIVTEASLEKDGNSTLLSVFFPPPRGWPKGVYQLVVTMKNKIETIDFEVN